MKLRFDRALDSWGNTVDRPVRAWIVAIVWLLVIGWLAFFWNLGSTGLVDETEPLFAEAARQMTVTGDYITPYFNEETRFDKPPLVYWLMAIAYSTIGVNEWAVRLPSALSAFALVCLGFYTLLFCGAGTSDSYTRSTPRNAVAHPRSFFCAGLGAALIALNPETIAWARIGVSDMLLTGCMCSALLCFFLGYAQPLKPQVQVRWYLAFYVLVGLAILAKGPVGIVLPGIIVGLFLLYVGKLREVLREMRILWGILLILAIAIPWYILVIGANGWNYINSFFGYHNIERFTGVVNNHSAPWYFYFLVVLLGFAPWSIYLPVAIAQTQFWQRSYWRSAHRSTHLGLFALIWFGAIFGFFTIAVTKLPSYVLPLMPAAAILVALLWSDRLNRREDRRQRTSRFLLWSHWLNVVFLLSLSAGLFALPHLIGSDPAIPNLRESIQQSNLPILAGLIWLVAAIAGIFLIIRRCWQGLLAVNLLGFILFLVFVVTPAYLWMDQARQQPLRELSAIARQFEPNEELIMIGFKKPSVVFYTQRPVTYVREIEKAVAYIQELQSNTPQPFAVMLLSYPQRLQQLQPQLPQYQNLGEAGAYQLVRVVKSSES
ncbi:ArnT family glycosyltransferase [Gloeocapsopsis dulcis]|uniref:Glycosyltransferase n=1 Tax=Gloeocapsopsis dulcis AAB1 = 1H9 TaxID=1433147 RepID=A0A6N8G1D8_9CHRO|nr:glycosyltransferase family 39 protein [Gloeocapsopsis dulcis]MUL39218.1 glycosyltransferase [Gloeocapsopsis dulcis AAB1 = 1H9]WNN90538.1 glycosyltransferase family 39 protein [Gloeocapsopsis dulcis]